MEIRRQWGQLFRSFDVVLAPTTGTLAFPHVTEQDTSKRRLTINGEKTGYYDQLAWPGIALVSHLPATATPVGFSKSGLPISVQVIGPYLEDRTTIAFSGLLEREFGGFKPPPPL